MALIEAQHVYVEQRIADVSFTLEDGEMLGIIGPNGSGKSTLLQVLAGILPYQGNINYTGQRLAALSPRQRAQHIGLLPQSCDSAWSLTVADVVALGRLPWGDEDAEAIGEAIIKSDIAPLLKRKIDQISGGERARVWLARVLAGQPRLLLADEPIASLDLRHQRSVMEVLRSQATNLRAVIVALHDLSLAARYCDTLCLMQGGQILAYGRPQEVLTEANLAKVFEIEVHVDLNANPPVIIPR